MAQPNVDTTGLVDAVSRARGTQASAVALIRGFAQRVTDAVVKAVQEDDAADEGTLAAVRAAIAEQADALNASSGDLAAAIEENNPSSGGSTGGSTGGDSGGGSTGGDTGGSTGGDTGAGGGDAGSGPSAAPRSR